MEYDSKSREELILICKERNIKGYSGKKKDDIVKLLTSLENCKKLTYIDLFSGIGGFRYGIELFQKKNPNYSFECVKTADIKKMAIKTYNHNFHEDNKECDVRKIKNIPYFDILCAGFPCQPFSSAGKQEGLDDKERGDLIFEVLRICMESRPQYLILENVSNIEKIKKGEILKKIIKEFEMIGYNITWISINSSDVGLAQDRKRIFIIGCLSRKIHISIKTYPKTYIKDIIDETDTSSSLPEDFLKKLLSIPKERLLGKSIKDKRGGKSNIHSWDINYHGKISEQQKNLLNTILLERRKKKWAIEKNMKWMDGIPLSLKDIQTFINYSDIEKDLRDLVNMNYLVLEYPKDLVNGKRIPNEKLEIGYNISKGKLSFPISKILHPNEVSPTLTATDSSKLAVIVGNTIRQLNEKELKRLCGFPDYFSLPPNVNKYDLFGNMVCPPVIAEILESLLCQSL